MVSDATYIFINFPEQIKNFFLSEFHKYCIHDLEQRIFRATLGKKILCISITYSERLVRLCKINQSVCYDVRLICVKEYNISTSGVCETTCKQFNYNLQSFIKWFEIASDVVKAEVE